jgi:hypothetical protein
MIQSEPMVENIAPRMYESAPIKRCAFPACKAGCCLHGVWLDRIEAGNIMENASLIKPHMPISMEDPHRWLDGRMDDDPFSASKKVVHSTVLKSPEHYGGTACVFLREDYKCALQVAGEAAGEHPWRFKPFYCILHPLDLDEQGRITLDETGLLVSEPASCLRKAEISTSLLKLFEAELRYLLGERTYEKLIRG